MGPIILICGIVTYAVLWIVTRCSTPRPMLVWIMGILYVLGKGLVYLFIAMFILPVMLLQFWVNLWCPITRGYSRKY